MVVLAPLSFISPPTLRVRRLALFGATPHPTGENYPRQQGNPDDKRRDLSFVDVVLQAMTSVTRECSERSAPWACKWARSRFVGDGQPIRWDMPQASTRPRPGSRP